MDRTTKGVKRASKSSYEIYFTYQGQPCRERIKLKPNTGNDLKANRFKHAIDQAIIDNTFDYAVTFPNSKKGKLFAKERNIYRTSNYMIEWMEKNEIKYKASTWKGKAGIINNLLIPELGNMFLDEIKRYHVRNVADSWDVTNKTISTRISVLRVILDDALDDELIDKNPLYGWSYKGEVDEVKEDDINPLNKDELKIFVDGQQVTEEKNMFVTLLFSGMRPCELVPLRWSDIEFSNGSIRINKSKTDAAKVSEIPKTKKSRRRIKILEPCYKALKSQQQITGLAGKHVFLNPRTGKPWTVGRIYKIWCKHLERLELEHRRMYQTRHTYASMMLSAGEPLMWVTEQLGHSDFVMVARIYAKWIPDANLDAGAKGVKIFWN